MIVADTSIWIDFFNGPRTASVEKLERALEERLVIVGDLILMEVLQGFRRDDEWLAAKLALDELPFEPMVGREIALMAASNHRKLRAAGITPRKTIDVLIATFCVENNHALIHADRDFDWIAKPLGLKTI